MISVKLIIESTLLMLVFLTSTANSQGVGRQLAAPEEIRSETDVDDGIDAGDKSILKRSKAIIQSAAANAKYNRKGHDQYGDNLSPCSARVNDLCIGANGSVIVLPGATVVGDIVNVPKRR